MTPALLAAPPATLSSDVVVLRAMTAEDWTLEQALSRDPEVIRWTTYPPHLTEEAARARMAEAAERARTWTGQRYAVCAPDGEVLGTAALTVERSPEPAVGYALLPAGRGRGMAVAAVRLMTDWLLSVGHPCVRLGMLPDNQASARVAGRAGFADLGVESSPRADGTVAEVRWWEHRG